MMKRLSVVLVVLALAFVCCSASFAAWTDTLMYVHDYPELTLTLSPSWSYDSTSGLYEYTYRLINTTRDEYIEGFTLAFPSAISYSALTPVEVPNGWTAIPRQRGNKINWVTVLGDEYQIAPGESMMFKFTCAYAPGTTQDVSASAQNTVGFSGVTYGPAVPEPSSFVALLTGLVGIAGLRRRK